MTGAARLPVPGWTVRRAFTIVERNLLTYKHVHWPPLSMMVEPVMYLLSIGFGVGALVGAMPGVHVRYAAYVAPAILATTAMNTAFNQTSFGLYFRLKQERTYDAIVPTPVSATDIAIGEVASAVINGLVTSIGFIAVMAVFGLIVSPGVLVSLPAAVLIGYAFAAGGIAVTTYVRDFADFQLIQLVMLPMYLFATTFYPLSTYPAALRPVIEILPLYQSIELVRGPALGTLTWHALIPVGYLIAFGTAALWIATRRMTRLLLH